MSEEQVVQKTPILRTRQSLTKELKQLGLDKGMVVIVHSSLSSLGWVCGGPVAVIQALMDVITFSGTIVMPTQSTDYSDPALWSNPPVPQEWWPIIRETMPAYEPNITPTRGVGIIAETFRKWPGVLRSSHPALSFGAWGKYAEKIIKDHSLDNGLGENSPLARIYDLDGWVLLLGVGYDRNTSFHLAEYRAPGARPFKAGAPILENGKRVWKEYSDIEFEAEVFPEIGIELERAGKVIKGLVGSAEAKFFKQRDAVDFAQEWLMKKRKSSVI